MIYVSYCAVGSGASIAEKNVVADKVGCRHSLFHYNHFKHGHLL